MRGDMWSQAHITDHAIIQFKLLASFCLCKLPHSHRRHKIFLYVSTFSICHAVTIIQRRHPVIKVFLCIFFSPLVSIITILSPNLKVEHCSPKNVKRLSFPKSFNILSCDKGSIRLDIRYWNYRELIIGLLYRKLFTMEWKERADLWCRAPCQSKSRHWKTEIRQEEAHDEGMGTPSGR